MRRLYGYCLMCLVGSFCFTAPTPAAEAPRLRYGFQAGREYGYEVKIVADTDDSVETREGVISYKVLSATDPQAVLKHSGTLASRSQPKPGAGVRFGPRMPGPPRFMGPRFVAGPEGVTLNRQGEMLVSRELTHLPFLLGDLELLVIEEFPAEAKAQWEKQRDILIQERQASAFPFFGPHAAEKTSQRTAKERFEYTVADAQGNPVRVTKKYSIRSGDEGGQAPRFEMNGSGEFSFDTKEGVISAMAMKYEIRVNEPNVTLRIPVTLNYRLLTPAEIAEHKKREEAARARMAEEIAKRNALKPFEAGEREKLLKDLHADDPGRIQTAADRLAKAPADDGAADFAKLLAPLLSHSNDWVKGAAAKALVIWATPEAEQELIKATTTENIWVRGPAILALGRVKTEKAAEAAAAQMYRNRGEAAKAMKEMGPVAETAAIGCLKDRDGWVRGEACQVLGEIGGENAIKALKEYAKRSSGFDVQHADKAISVIEKRLEGGGKPMASSASAGSPKAGLRTWRDASGVFEVEATLLELKDGKVRLKRKDGRVISVPLDKLSEADQALARQQGK